MPNLEKIVRSPDASFGRSERLPGESIDDRFISCAPDLAAEVRSGWRQNAGGGGISVTAPRLRATMLPHADELRSLSPAEHLMSMPAVRRRRWTLDEVERLADELGEPADRYELVDGELLVTPAPTDRHQRIVGELFALLREYTRRHRLGEVRLGPARARVTAESRFQPDVFVVPAIEGRFPRADDGPTPLLLVVEVLSPGSARHDRVTKRRFFQRHRVPEFWAVDGDAEVFEIWRPDDERAAFVDDRVVWAPDTATPPLEIDVPRFFADLADEEAGLG